MSTLFNKVNQKIDQLESNRFGIMAVTITLGSCWASVAAMLLLNGNHFWMLYPCTITAMGANALAIAQAPFRWVIWSFLISILVNTVIIAGLLI